MTSISGISATQRPTRDDSEMKARFERAMQPAADLLGMSVSELQEAQKSGKTLEDLAKEKGVEKDDLVDALAKGLEENKPADAPTDIDFTKMATDIVEGKGPGGHRGPPPGPHPAESTGENDASSSLDELLSKLGVSADDLATLLSQLSADSDDSSSTGADPISTLKAILEERGSPKGVTYDTKL